MVSKDLLDPDEQKLGPQVFYFPNKTNNFTEILCISSKGGEYS